MKKRTTAKPMKDDAAQTVHDAHSHAPLPEQAIRARGDAASKVCARRGLVRNTPATNLWCGGAYPMSLALNTTSSPMGLWRKRKEVGALGATARTV